MLDRSNLETTDLPLFRRMLEVNTIGPFALIKAALPELRKTRGSVLNIGSVNAWSGEPNLMAYSVSKGALMTLTRNAASALNRYRIRVNQLNVGWTLTEGEDAVQKKQGTRADWLADAVGMMPFRRLLTPREIAYAAAYFASDESALITLVRETDEGLDVVLQSQSAADKAALATGDGSYRLHTMGRGVLLASTDRPLPDLAPMLAAASPAEDPLADLATRIRQADATADVRTTRR